MWSVETSFVVRAPPCSDAKRRARPRLPVRRPRRTRRFDLRDKHRHGSSAVVVQFTQMSSTYTEFVLAMQRIEDRLLRVTAALEAAGVPYAVVGGSAVAAWVASIVLAATRTTKDIDLLVRRADLDRITAELGRLGFRREDLRSLILFLAPDEPSRKSGVHLFWASERVRPSYQRVAPGVDEVTRSLAPFAVLDLAALVRMKLTSLRDIDRVHVADLLRVGLITDKVRARLPADLLVRLSDVESHVDDD